MPNITISGLPPVITPLDNVNTLFEVTVLEAGQEVSRRLNVTDLVAAISGLDATFLTLSPNVNLPNERVLTEGTGITFVDTGPNGTLTINAAGISFPLLAPDGLVSAPSYSFASDPDSGMYLNGVGELSFAADGVEICRAINGAQNQFAIALSGQSSVPDLTSLADLDTGFRWTGSNQVVWIGGGSRAWNFSTSRFFSQFSNGPSLENIVSQSDVPTVLPDQGDSNTGLGVGTGDELSLIAGGVEGVNVDETAGAIQVTVDPGLTNTSDAAPPLAFGGGTVGFRSPDSDQIFAILSGAAQWRFTTVDFNANITDGPALRFVNPSDTVPSLLPNQNDTDTGIGTVGPNALNLITGALEALEFAASGGQVLQINLPETGITASTTQTQGERPLISSYNEVSVVANTNDTVTAPGVRAGIRLTIINNGGNTLQVFPAAGDDFGAGVDTAITIAAGAIGIFLGRDSTNWDILSNNTSSGVSFPLLAPDGTAGAPSYSFSGATDMGVFRVGGFLGFTTAGVLRWAINNTELTANLPGAPLFRGAVVASATVPTIMPNNTDINTGLGWNAADQLSLVAGGVEIARATEVASANQFAIAQSGNSSVPELTSLADPDTGFRWTAGNQVVFIGGGTAAWNWTSGQFFSSFSNGAAMINVAASPLVPPFVPNRQDLDTGLGWANVDQLSMISGGVEALRMSEASSRIIQTNANHVGLTASVTQTQGGGLALLSSYNEIATVANVGDALTAFDVAAGTRLVVINNGANDLQLFPAVGDDIGAGVDTAITIAAGAIGIFLGRTAVIWDTLYNAIASPGGGGAVANDAVQARRTTDFLLTTAFVDITMDTTDIETDAAVIDHDLGGNDDNIIFGVAGTYQIFVDVTANPDSGTPNRNMELNARVRLNDAGTGIVGSVNHSAYVRDGSLDGFTLDIHFSFSFVATFSASDFITLQLSKTLIGGSLGTDNAIEISMKAMRLL